MEHVLITCHNERNTCAHVAVCGEKVVRNTMVSLSEHVMITWCTLNWQCTQYLYIHMLYCAEKHAMVSTTILLSCKHVHLTNSSTGLLTSGLIYNTSIGSGTHTYPSPVPNSTHVCTFGYPSMSHRPDTIYKKENKKLELIHCKIKIKNFSAQVTPRFHVVAVEKI